MAENLSKKNEKLYEDLQSEIAKTCQLQKLNNDLLNEIEKKNKLLEDERRKKEDERKQKEDKEREIEELKKKIEKLKMENEQLKQSKGKE